MRPVQLGSNEGCVLFSACLLYSSPFCCYFIRLLNGEVVGNFSEDPCVCLDVLLVLFFFCVFFLVLCHELIRDVEYGCTCCVLYSLFSRSVVSSLFCLFSLYFYFL